MNWIPSLAALCLLTQAPSAYAAKDILDVSAMTGVAFGTVSQQQKLWSSKKFMLGGIPLGLAIYQDIAPSWTVHLDIQAILDIVGKQQIRQGLSGTLNYHILGGAKRMSTSGPILHSTSRYLTNLSLAFRGGVYHFSASNAEDPSLTLSGSLWDLAAGIEYRQDIGEFSSIGSSLMSTVMTPLMSSSSAIT